jgi:hypothetical protein
LGTSVIFHDLHPDEDLMQAAREVGDEAICIKGRETDEIAQTIHAVCAGTAQQLRRPNLGKRAKSQGIFPFQRQMQRLDSTCTQSLFKVLCMV